MLFLLLPLLFLTSSISTGPKPSADSKRGSKAVCETREGFIDTFSSREITNEYKFNYEDWLTPILKDMYEGSVAEEDLYNRFQLIFRDSAQTIKNFEKFKDILSGLSRKNKTASRNFDENIAEATFKEFRKWQRLNNE